MPPTLQEVLEIMVQEDSAALEHVAQRLGGIDDAAKRAGQSLNSINPGSGLSDAADKAERLGNRLESVRDGSSRAGQSLREAGGHAGTFAQGLDAGASHAERLGGQIQILTGHLGRSIGDMLGFGNAAGMASQQLGQANEVIATMPGVLAPIGASVAAVSVGLAAAGVAVAQFIGNAGRINQLAQTFDLSRAQVLGLSTAMSRLGLDEDRQFQALTQLSNGIETYSQSIASGSKAVTPFALGLEQIGVGARNADGSIKSVSQVLPDIADGFQRSATAAAAGGPAFNAAAVAVDLFGRYGALLVPLLERGGEAMRASTEEASKSVLVTKEAATAWAMWVETSADVKHAIDEVTGSLGVALAPALSEILQRITPVIESFVSFAAHAGPAVAAAIETVANAFGALFSGNFASFGEQMGAIIRAVATGIVNLATAVVDHLPDFLAGLATLADQAGTWGFNLAVAFAQGLMAGAAEAITAAAEEIAGMIAAFFESFSPPKKGPLSTIDQWGGNLIETYLAGMSKADFTVLDQVTQAIKQRLQINVTGGELDNMDLIPRLLGGEAAVAQAISEMHEFGQVTEETMGRIRDSVGTGADEVTDLFNALVKLGETESQLSEVKNKISDVEGQLRSLSDAERESTNDLKDSISDWDRYFERLKSGYQDSIGKLTEWIRLRSDSYKPDDTKIDAQIAGARVDKDRLDLQNAMAAPAKRHADDLDKEKKDQAELDDLLKKKNKTESDNYRIQKLQQDLGEIRRRGATATPDENLAILEATKRLTDDIGKSEAANDGQLQQANHDLETTKNNLSEVNAQQKATEGPLKQNLSDITSWYERQKEPLQHTLDNLQSQEQSLQAQRDRENEVVSTLHDRLDAEGKIASEIDAQNKLLEQQAKGAGGAGRGGGGGAGRGGAGLGGIGGLPKIGAGGFGAALSEEEKNRIKAGIDAARAEVEKQINSADFSGATAKLQQHIHDAVIKAMHGAFSNLQFDGALIGGLLGASLGGPAGAALGAVVGAAVGKSLSTINWNAVLADNFRLEGAGIGATLGAVIGFELAGPIGAAAGALIGTAIGEKTAEALERYFQSHKIGLKIDQGGLKLDVQNLNPTPAEQEQQRQKSATLAQQEYQGITSQGGRLLPGQGTGAVGGQPIPPEPFTGVVPRSWFNQMPNAATVPVPGAVGAAGTGQPVPLPLPEPEQGWQEKLKSKIQDGLKSLAPITFDVAKVLSFVFEPGVAISTLIGTWFKTHAKDIESAIGKIKIDLGKLIDIGGDLAGGVGSAVGSAFSGLGSTVSSALSGLGGSIGSAFSGIGSQVSGALSGIGTSISTFFGSLPGLAQGGLDSLGSLWSGAMTSLKQTAGDIWEGLSTAWGTFISGLSTKGAEIVSWISDAWTSGWKAAQTAVTTVASAIETAWKDSVGAVLIEGGKLSSWLGDTLGPAWEAVKLAASHVADFFTQTIPGAFSGVAGAVSGLSGPLGTVAQLFRDITSAAQTAIGWINSLNNTPVITPGGLGAPTPRPGQGPLIGAQDIVRRVTGPATGGGAFNPDRFTRDDTAVSGGSFSLGSLLGLRAAGSGSSTEMLATALLGAVAAPLTKGGFFPNTRTGQQGDQLGQTGGLSGLGLDAIPAQVQAVQQSVKDAMDKIVADVQGALKTVEGAFSDSMQRVIGIVSQQMASLSGSFNSWGQYAGFSWTQALAQAIGSGSGDVGKAVAALAQQMVNNLLTSIQSGTAGPGGGGGIPQSQASIAAFGKRMAGGGSAKGWFVAGDPGPNAEAVYAPGGAFVVPAHLTKLMANMPHYAGGTVSADDAGGQLAQLADEISGTTDRTSLGWRAAYLQARLILDPNYDPVTGQDISGGDVAERQDSFLGAASADQNNAMLSYLSGLRQTRFQGIRTAATMAGIRQNTLFNAASPAYGKFSDPGANPLFVEAGGPYPAGVTWWDVYSGYGGGQLGGSAFNPTYGWGGNLGGPQSMDTGESLAAFRQRTGIADMLALGNMPTPAAGNLTIDGTPAGAPGGGSGIQTINLQAAIVFPDNKVIGSAAGSAHMDDQSMRADVIAPSVGSR